MQYESEMYFLTFNVIELVLMMNIPVWLQWMATHSFM